MKFRAQLNHLFVLLLFGLAGSVIIGYAQVPDLTGTWNVTITGVNGADEFRWELKKGRAITPDHNSWGITRTLVQTSNDTKRQFLGKTEFAGSIEFIGGKLGYRAGVNMFQQTATCELTGDVLTCKGTETIGLANGREFDFTIRGNRIGGTPKTVEATKQERLPVIFLPGVAGTLLGRESKENPHIAEWAKPKDKRRLQNDSYEEKWPFSPKGRREQLALKEDGKTAPLLGPDSRIALGDILAAQPTDFYGGLRYLFQSKGYNWIASPTMPPPGSPPGVLGTMPRQYFEFPYDWRLDNETHFTALDELITTALSENPNAKKVKLLAHSMGGYIARAYILSDPGRAAKVDSLITMGTPYWGAPKPYYGAISGYTFGNPSVRQELMKILIQNWPAAYQLMPNYQFIWDALEKRWLTLEEASRIKYKWFTGVKEFELWKDSYYETSENVQMLNRTLVEIAWLFNKPLGRRENPTPLPSGIKHYAIVGTGVKTLADFHMTTASYMEERLPEKYLDLGNRKVMLSPCFRLHDGDGTVSLEGSVISTATTYYVPYVVKWGFDSSSAHGDLPANSTVQKIVGDIVDGNPPDPNSYSYQKANESIDLEESANFTLRSDARLSIRDVQTGRILGFNESGGIEENFPSGSFIAMENVEYAAIADTKRPLMATIRGIRDGKFTLEVNINRRGAPAKRFAFREVAVVNGTIAQVSMTPANITSEMPTLSVTTAGQIRQVQAVALPPIKEDHPRLVIPTGGGGQSSATGAFLGTIPSVGGTVSAFRFFKTNEDIPPPQGMREYQTRFSKATLGTVYYEFSVKYVTENAANFTMVSTWARGPVPLVRQELPVAKPANWNTSTRSYGYGSKEPGKWETGTYTVKVEVEGRKVAEGSFVVY